MKFSDLKNGDVFRDEISHDVVWQKVESHSYRNLGRYTIRDSWDFSATICHFDPDSFKDFSVTRISHKTPVQGRGDCQYCDGSGKILLFSHYSNCDCRS